MQSLQKQESGIVHVLAILLVIVIGIFAINRVVAQNAANSDTSYYEAFEPIFDEAVTKIQSLEGIDIVKLETSKSCSTNAGFWDRLDLKNTNFNRCYAEFTAYLNVPINADKNAAYQSVAESTISHFTESGFNEVESTVVGDSNSLADERIECSIFPSRVGESKFSYKHGSSDVDAQMEIGLRCYGASGVDYWSDQNEVLVYVPIDFGTTETQKMQIRERAVEFITLRSQQESGAEPPFSVDYTESPVTTDFIDQYSDSNIGILYEGNIMQIEQSVIEISGREATAKTRVLTASPYSENSTEIGYEVTTNHVYSNSMWRVNDTRSDPIYE